MARNLPSRSLSRHERAFVFCSAVRGRCVRGRLYFATRPLLTSFGRTPASGRRAPQNGWLRRCLNSRLGSLFVAQDEPRHEREPQQPRKRLVTSPHLGGCVVQTRGSGRARSARRGDVAYHEPRLRLANPNLKPSGGLSPARQRGGQRTSDSEGPLGAERVALGVTPAKQKHPPAQPLQAPRPHNTHTFLCNAPSLFSESSAYRRGCSRGYGGEGAPMIRSARIAGSRVGAPSPPYPRSGANDCMLHLRVVRGS